jgi:rubredoxin
MRDSFTIKINFRGGIISPGDLYNILVAAGRAGVRNVRFGLRQQLLIPVDGITIDVLLSGLRELGIPYETDHEYYPNIVSSYPAEEVFINNTWLSEGVYKDIFDGFSHQPRLKINVSDSNQSFTPMLTGNINWVASAFSQHYWHLFIRFPKTNIIYEWSELIYTNDVARLSEEIESTIFQHAELFYDNPAANGRELFELVNKERYITKPAEQPAALPQFNLPYYEGLNRHNNKYWLGIYRRDELYPIQFLKDACRLCLDTKIGLLCSTPWKTIIVKGIEEKDKEKWSRLLEKYDINMRHAANELNFQVEDNSPDALSLKNYLVKKLSDEDTRTFGVCIGIKTKKKTEVFSSILIKRKPLLSFFGVELFHVYDILCAEEFNPNKRTAAIVSSNNFKFLLGEQLRRTILSYAKHRAGMHAKKEIIPAPVKEKLKATSDRQVQQCSHCLTVYDETLGEPDRGIAAGTVFENLPTDFTCSLCEGPKIDFIKVPREKLGLQAI